MNEQIPKQIIVSDSELASRLQGHARHMSFDDPNNCCGTIKQDLLEASHRLDSNHVTVTRKSDGLFIRNARGKCNYMTIRQRIAYWLLGNKTEIRP